MVRVADVMRGDARRGTANLPETESDRSAPRGPFDGGFRRSTVSARSRSGSTRPVARRRRRRPRSGRTGSRRWTRARRSPWCAGWRMESSQSSSPRRNVESRGPGFRHSVKSGPTVVKTPPSRDRFGVVTPAPVAVGTGPAKDHSTRATISRSPLSATSKGSFDAVLSRSE